jgi:PAS domain S-box-containing protein
MHLFNTQPYNKAAEAPALGPRFRQGSRAIALVVTALGATGLCGWIFNLPALTTIRPATESMKFNTAVLFVCLGIALWTVSDDIRQRGRFILGLLIVLIAGLTLLEYLFGVSLGIDQFFVRDTRTPAMAHPGRMGIATVSGFLLLGLAVLSLGRRKARFLQRAAVIVCFTLSLVGLCGYLYGIRSLYSISSFSTMAAPTALGFMAACLAYFLARPNEGLTSIAAGDGHAGVLLRSVVPMVVAAPMLLGWLMLTGERANQYDMKFGVALLVLCNIGCLAVVTALVARSLNRSEQAQKEAKRALEKTEEKFSKVFRESPLAITLTSITKGDRYIDVNEPFERITGWGREEVIGRTVYDVGVWDPGQRAEVVKRLSRGGTVQNLEIHIRAKNGEVRTGLSSAVLIQTNDEQCLLSAVVDITDLKRSEEARQVSDGRFRQFFETLPEYCYMISPDGTILDVNPGACEALGYSKKELLGRPVSTLYAPESHLQAANLLERWKKTGRIRSEEMIILTKQGEKRSVLLNVGSIMDPAGNLLHSASVQVDITERKRIEQKLRENQERSRELVFRSPVAMVVTHGPGQENELVNLKFTELFGYSIEDVPDEEHWWPLAYPDEAYRATVRAEWKRRVEAVLTRKAKMEPMEASVRCKDGSSRHIEFHFASLGETSLVSCVDLTDRQRVESKLRESEERFRLVANAAPVMIWMSDVDKLCIFFNQTWLEFTGRSLDAELGNGWAEGVHSEDLERCLDTYTKAFDRRESFQMEYRLRRHDGEYRWIYDLGVPRYGPDGSFVGYIGSCTDVTAHKSAEEALSMLSQRLIEAQEEERSRIARELHDDISQRLAMLALSLTGLKSHTPASADELEQEVGATLRQVDGLARDVQALSHRLHSSSLDHLGLAVAAEGFSRELSSRQGLQIDFDSENVPKDLPKEISLCLFRVLQEALQNAVKHSGSRRFQVSLKGRSNEICLTVRDTGIGFNSREAMKGHGLGLTSMKERLKLINGELSIGSQLQHGTTIHARVPFTPNAKKFVGTR